MQTVLITGANGFLAQYLIRVLRDNYKVVGTGRGEARFNLDHPNVYYRNMDFTDPVAVAEVIAMNKPDVIVHAGAISQPDVCEGNKPLADLTNTESTGYLLEAAAACKSFFIFLSSCFVFNGTAGMYTEEDEPEPVNYYGETKLRAEALVRAYAHAWSIVRTVLVYGKPEGGHPNLPTLVAEKLQRGEAYSVFNDQVRTPTYVEDLAGGIEAIISRRAEGVYHLSGKDLLTPYQIALATAKLLGLDDTLLTPVTAETFSHGAARPKRTGFCIDKARHDLGYDPVSFEEGLRKTFS
ncbi:MAG TPA: SDR family oxidoreductase [Flavisolibacter sp.]|nr:SDR family oxidoreductase [Flavisolibacter sp.]